MTANRSFQFRQASLVPLCGWVWVFAAFLHEAPLLIEPWTLTVKPGSIGEGSFAQSSAWMAELAS